MSLSLPSLRRSVVAALVLSLVPPVAFAGLAAHEVLVLVNQQSPRSMEVANHFVHLRQIPARNVIYLNLPDQVLEPRAELSPADFTRHIWEPAQAAVQERDLDDQILAWIYSVDFPIRITYDPPVSLTGLTFLRNRVPAERDLIDQGRYLSPLYAGPDSPDGPKVEGGSLIRYKEALDDDLPLPAMMLGFCGSRGTDTDTVLRTLRDGRTADRSAPRGTVYWITSDDVRSRMRAWQFRGAREELHALRVRSDISAETAANLRGIIGLQMGADSVRADQVGGFLPGSMAEHLTSHGAEFHLPIQSKVTDWLRAGATATAGTVTEPYSIWAKFPHARFFAHYARGHTILESFYLSLRSPAQTLLLGEPLARPWAPPMTLSLIGLDKAPLSNTTSFITQPLPSLPEGQREYRIVADGKAIPDAGLSAAFSFDTRELSDGYHELRVLAYGRSTITHSVMDRTDLIVRNRGRSVNASLPDEYSGDKAAAGPLAIHADAEGEPDRIELIHNERVLATSNTNPASFNLHPGQVGAGPVSVQLRAVYPDAMQVHSKPLSIRFARPTADAVVALRTIDQSNAPRPYWDGTGARVTGGDLTQRAAGEYVFRPEGTASFNIAVAPATNEPLASFSARIMIPWDRPATTFSEWAGLVFNYQHEEHFDFFALHGQSSAWSFGRYRDGQVEHVIERGAPFLQATRYTIDLVFDDRSVTAYVDGAPIATWSQSDRSLPGKTGLLAGKRRVLFEQIRLQAVE